MDIKGVDMKKDKHNIIVILKQIITQHGKKQYRLLSFKGIMGKDILPYQYLKGTYFYSGCEEGIDYIYFANNDLENAVCCGSEYDIDRIDKLTNAISQGVVRLKLIKDEFRIKKESWHSKICMKF
jgi:hypothetical protein